MADIPWGDHLTQAYVPGLGVDGVGGMVLLQPLGRGLGEEIQDGLPLLQDLKGVVPSAESLHEPGGVKRPQETPGTAGTSRPEGLEVRKGLIY